MSWIPCCRFYRCTLWCQTAPYGAPLNEERADCAEWIHLHTLHISNSAGGAEKSGRGQKTGKQVIFQVYWMQVVMISCSTDWLIRAQELTNLLFLMQHDMRFETGHTRELFMARGAGGVRGRMCGLVESEVELHIKRLCALVTSMRL